MFPSELWHCTNPDCHASSPSEKPPPPSGIAPRCACGSTLKSATRRRFFATWISCARTTSQAWPKQSAPKRAASNPWPPFLRRKIPARAHGASAPASCTLGSLILMVFALLLLLGTELLYDALAHPLTADSGQIIIGSVCLTSSLLLIALLLHDPC